MKSTAKKREPQWLLTASLLVLLVVLASLQYRWLESVRVADREKSRAVLETAVERFTEDFDRELTRAFLGLRPPPGARSPDDGFAERWQHWQDTAPWPELVRQVFAVHDASAVESPAEEGSGLARFDPTEGSFLTTDWPDELTPLGDRVRSLLRHRLRSEPPDGSIFLADETPALIVPLFGFHPGRGLPGREPHGENLRGAGPPGGGRGRRDRGPPDGFPFGREFLILWLDQQLITENILPRLTERYLGNSDQQGYHVRVVALDDQREIFRGGTAMQGSMIRNGESGDGNILDGDASVPFFALLPTEALGSLRLERSPGEEMRDGPRGGRARGLDGRLGGNPWFRRIYSILSSQEQPRWRLVVSHPAGSLEAAVDRAHRSNLAISFGILLLLGTSLLLMLLSTRRTQALARQQLEFVAGVTHELLTPLAAMRSAGQNLADGVVTESAQVQRYGRLIEDEGRRLTTMVGQVLEFAGMQAGRRTYTLRRTDPREVLAKALDEYRSVLDEQGFSVESHLEDGLPSIMADPEALRRALQNLIANAIKYGSAGSWIGLEARRVEGPDGPELCLTVADRGPGIAAADMPRLFEPFYRGQNGSDDQIPGSGLGLSLVKHIASGHGGRVTVSTTKDQGSRFTLHLPAGEDGPTEDGPTENSTAKDPTEGPGDEA